MRDRHPDLGPAGETVAENVGRLRREQNLTYPQLERRLADVGRRIPVLGLRRLEANGRRVDVDDLLALALVFGVAPITLLMPERTDPEAAVVTTGISSGQSAHRVWEWFTAQVPVDGQEFPDGRRLSEFRLRSQPGWDAETGVLQLRLAAVRSWVKSALEPFDQEATYVGVPQGQDRRPVIARRLRQEARSLALALEQLADDLEHEAAQEKARGDG